MLLSLFLDWYDIGISGWNAFETWDVVLAAIALAVLVSAIPAVTRRVAIPSRTLGPVALLVVLVQVLNPPPAATGSAPEAGAWLALIGALAVVIGQRLSHAGAIVPVRMDESTTRVVPGRGLRGS